MKSITPDIARQLVREGENETHAQRHAQAQDRLLELVECARTHSAYFKAAYENIAVNISSPTCQSRPRLN